MRRGAFKFPKNKATLAIFLVLLSTLVVLFQNCTQQQSFSLKANASLSQASSNPPNQSTTTTTIAGPPATIPATAGHTYFVATNGNNSTGDGSAAKPWKEISYGISRMVGGDILVVKNGLYTGTQNFIINPPSGSGNAITTIMAETPMEVRIQGTGSQVDTDAKREILYIEGHHIKVDGFVFDWVGSNNSYSSNGWVYGDYNRVMRSIFKRSSVSVMPNTQDGSLLGVTGNNNLVEDVAGVGYCRYCFYQGGPTATTQRNIWRRVVGRLDYSDSGQPKRVLTTYGNDDSNNVQVRDHLFQNIIVLDGNDVKTGFYADREYKYSGLGVGKAVVNLKMEGLIVVNESVGYGGIYVSEFTGGNTLINSAVWNLSGSTVGSIWNTQAYAPWAVISNQSGDFVDHLTIGGSIPGGYYRLSYSSATPTNSLLGSTPLNILNNPTGAVIMKRYGVSGTLWGETGYDTLTNEDLWPWPYEAKIKAIFSEQNDPPPNTVPGPGGNNTSRGFCAAGSGLYGGPITLTSYIWEITGTACPVNICH